MRLRLLKNKKYPKEVIPSAKAMGILMTSKKSNNPKKIKATN